MRTSLALALTILATGVGIGCGGIEDSDALALAEECYGQEFDECHKNSHVQEEDFTEFTCKAKDERYPLAVDNETNEASC